MAGGLEALGVKDLRRLLALRDVDSSNCVEKSEPGLEC